MGILDFFFPKRCVHCKAFGDYVCTACFTYISFDVVAICLVCGRQTYNSLTHPACSGRYVIDGAFSSIVFGKVAKKLVYSLKYHSFISDIVPFLAQLTYEGIIQQESFSHIPLENVIFVPVPLYASRYRARGYNQAQLLAKKLSEIFRRPMIEALVRTRNTLSQVKLSKNERHKNIAGAFQVKKGMEEMLVGKTILLVDDVLTSGATLLEAGRVLKKAGAKYVYGLTLAHGQ